MSMKRISAIVPIDLLIPLEKHLRQCGVHGITVEHVQGYGEHPNFFRRDLMQENARILLYADEAEVDGLVAAIVSCAHECGAMAGILAVASIDRLVNLTNGDDITSMSS